ncbi:MAG: ATP-binding protein [Treponemataceae bacterium]|nr:ATP-binding protein [Treponemataceae bacterium]
MNNVQKISFEILLVVINVFISVRCQFRKEKAMLQRFSRYSVALSFFLVINLFVRLYELYIISWNRNVMMAFYTFSLFLQVLVSYEWFKFVETINDRSFFSRNMAGKILAFLPVCFVLVTIIMNIKSGFLFILDEDNMYQRGNLFFLQVAPPFSYVFICFAASTHAIAKNDDKHVIVFFFTSFIPIILSTVLQILFGGSFIMAGFTCVCVFAYIELCLEEIQEIDKTKADEEAHKKLVEAKKKAEAANRAKSKFLADMSHEIRTPLNGVVGFTNLARKNIGNNEKVHENLEEIKKAGNNLLNKIEKILVMSRIDSGKMEVIKEEENLLHVLGGLEARLKPAADEKNIDFSVNTDELVHEHVFTDSKHLDMVLVNLTENALNFTKNGGKVLISVKEIPDLKPDVKNSSAGKSVYEIRVKDNGAGMAKDFAESIFEPFTRKYNPKVSQVQGTGLGLAITKSLVKMMGGDVAVQTEEGKGSEFLVTLPMEFLVLENIQDGEFPESGYEFSGEYENRNILVVEDNVVNQDIATDVLKDGGFSVDTANNGLEAVEMIRNAPANKYALVLMDIHMPVMDGLEATVQIRKLEDTAKACIPIFAVTADWYDEERQKAMDAGMNGQISKAFDISEVNEIMQHLPQNTRRKK